MNENILFLLLLQRVERDWRKRERESGKNESDEPRAVVVVRRPPIEEEESNIERVLARDPLTFETSTERMRLACQAFQLERVHSAKEKR